MPKNKALRSALEAAFNAENALSNAEATQTSSRRKLDEDDRRDQNALETLDRLLDER